jgi:hypothetical protein
MNLHVFNDIHGFTLNLTVKRFEDKNVLDNNIFINLTQKTKYTNSHVIYLERSLRDFRRFLKTTSDVRKVTFYPFDFVAAFFLKELRKLYPDVEVGWAFWSYEYYHRPELYLSTLDPFSLNYYKKQNNFAVRSKRRLITAAKKILSRPVYNKQLLEESYQFITRFHSFLPADFKSIKNISGTCRSYQLSFLSVEEITAGIAGEKKMTNEIMIGHAGSITGNHAEIIQELAEIKIDNKFLIPIEYGDENYIKEIRSMAMNLLGDNVQFLEQRMSKEEYFKRLSNVGLAIFNFKTQEGLGNIFFLLWNGTKIFLREESSAYKQFKEWGLSIFSVENDLNRAGLAHLLTEKEAAENRRIIEEIFSESKVESYWKLLM